ncbi:MAG: hypothetical protein M3076_20640 [Actinomycetota bacterium]|nr:hypothetical protein [Actinomycetota bacterium]
MNSSVVTGVDPQNSGPSPAATTSTSQGTRSPGRSSDLKLRREMQIELSEPASSVNAASSVWSVGLRTHAGVCAAAR